MDQYIATPANKPVLFDNQEQGDYHFYTLKETAANVMVFQLNLNHVDPVKNELFNNREFRQALSVAVDRQALIDAVFVGQGAPAQPSIAPTDPLYNERLAKQHTEYDPDAANAILDTLLPNKDGEGYRLDCAGPARLDHLRARPDAHDLPRHVPARRSRCSRRSASTRRSARWTARSGRPASARAASSTPPRTSSAPTAASPRCSTPATSCRSRPTRSTRPAGALLHRRRTIRTRSSRRPTSRRQQELYKQLLGHRRRGQAAGDHGADPRERRRPVPGLRREPAAGRLRRGQERHGQHHAETMPNSFGWPTPGPVAARAVLQGRS